MGTRGVAHRKYSRLPARKEWWSASPSLLQQAIASTEQELAGLKRLGAPASEVTKAQDRLDQLRARANITKL